MQARLTIVRGSAYPSEYEFNTTQIITLGRSQDSTIILRDDHASRKHAQVYFEGGHWLLRDLGGRNGTRINGVRIQQPVRLVDGQDIGIADMCIRFHVVTESPTPPPLAATPTPNLEWAEPATGWQSDELALLHEFMGKPIKEVNGADLVRRALEVVRKQTGATVCGFLSLDPVRPLPRIVEPEAAQVNTALSQQLTQRVKKDHCRVWLKEASGHFDDSDSLMPFHDAVCVPLQAEGTPLGALHAYKNSQFFTQREVQFCEMVAGFAASHLALLRHCRTLEAENTRLRSQTVAFDNLIGDSAGIQQIRQQIAKVASCPSTVLIQGETGSGKELVAEALHRQSERQDGPFVVVNCGAIAPTLLESELFGHTEGSFTGARRTRQGYFQQADNGTLFLDEVGDMPLECQVKLLRVIEGKCFLLVGGERPVQPDVRVVAATHKDLMKEVMAGRFREDLYYRLCVIPLRVPPLRERLDDLPALAEHFVSKFAKQINQPKQLSAAALQRLSEYSWPGNIRELRTVIESAVMLSECETISPQELRLQSALNPELPSLNLEHLEAWAIRQALKRTQGNISAAARVVDVARDTFGQKMKKYGISKDEWRE